MQMRFDGKLGFPGGFVEPGEDIVVGLNRELIEEIKLDTTKHAITKEDFLFSHYIPNKDDEKRVQGYEYFLRKKLQRRSMKSWKNKVWMQKSMDLRFVKNILFSYQHYIKQISIVSLNASVNAIFCIPEYGSVQSASVYL